jgi:hypothetical protein
MRIVIGERMEGERRVRERTMELVLDDVVRVLEWWLMLSGKRISGMKELIDSILHRTHA